LTTHKPFVGKWDIIEAMSDPALMATKRVAGRCSDPSATVDLDDILAGAREALKPLREIVEQLHGLEYMPPEYNAYNAAEVDHLVDALQALIYTTEELTNECHG